MASDLNGATDPGDPAVATVDPGEFAARWNALDAEQRAGFLQAMRAANDAAVQCRMLHQKPRRFNSIEEMRADAERQGEPEELGIVQTSDGVKHVVVLPASADIGDYREQPQRDVLQQIVDRVIQGAIEDGLLRRSDDPGRC